MQNVCEICGNIEDTASVEIGDIDVILCKDCRSTIILKCDCCNKIFLANDEEHVVTSSGEVFCENCRYEELSYCECCDEYVRSDEVSYVRGANQYWCSDCIDNYAHECECCGQYTSQDYGDENITLCENCYEDNYFTCYECDEVIHQDYRYWYGDESYCEDCYKKIAGPIEDYSYRPTPKFQCHESEKEEVILPYLGFELESGGLKNEYDCKKIAESIYDCEKTFYLKHDGSIPDYGFELVSHPITLKRHKEIAWEKIFDEMIDAGLKSHDLGHEACGLHVHVSRNFLTPYKWLLVDYFISKHQTQWETIARRKEVHWARFKKIENGEHLKDSFGKTSGSRYQAVNFENYKTVEFRLFRGTLKYTTFMATLELIDGLVKWAKQFEVKHVLNPKKDLFKDYTDFIKADKELYSNAINYLTQKGLI